jgi:hypothetical protein
VIARAVGPSLAPFGVTGFLADPKMEFYSGTTKVIEDDDWGGGQDQISSFAKIGAFPLTAAQDATLFLTLAAPAGGNTVRVSGKGNATGTVLAELYDNTPVAVFNPTTPRLLNLSVLKDVGPGLTVGFIIGGTDTMRVLIRGIGPSLAAFGVGGPLADPKIELFNGQSQSIATNDNWGDAGALAAATIASRFTQVGAFGLSSPASKDAALFSTLVPGNYTVQVRSADATTGLVLVEVYEVP